MQNKTLGAGKTASPVAHFSLTNALKAVAFAHGSEVMDKGVSCYFSLTLVCHEPPTHWGCQRDVPSPWGTTRSAEVSSCESAYREGQPQRQGAIVQEQKGEEEKLTA